MQRGRAQKRLRRIGVFISAGIGGRHRAIIAHSVWAKGVTDGIPIALSYFAVSFTFGIAAHRAGLSTFASGIMSAVNIASAGQFAGLGILAASGGLLLTAATAFVVNLRYALMSATLSQKLDPSAPITKRLALACVVTDEIFALSALRPGMLNTNYSYGLAFLSIPAWIFGTVAGAISGGLLPPRVLSALGVAIYGMFIGIVVPPAKKDRMIACVVICSIAASFASGYLPLLRDLSGGGRIIALTIAISAIAAFVSEYGPDRGVAK